MSLRPFVVLVALPVVAICAPQADSGRIQYVDAEIEASARLKRVTHAEKGDFVWGNLSIKGTKKVLLSADIDCFALRIGDSKSDEVWIDNLVDVSRGNYPARNGEVFVQVYWPMKNFKSGTDADFARAELVLLPRYSGSCFQFAP